jgi:subtilisin family serine protease
MARAARVRTWLSSVALAVLALPAGAPALEGAPDSSNAEFVAGELLIKLQPRADLRALDAELTKHRAKRMRRLFAQRAPPRLKDVYVLQVGGAADVRAVADQLARLPDVVYAEPNWIYQMAATPLPPLPLVPDDRFVTQDGVTWSEGAWGQSFLDLWGLEKIRALEAWNAFDTDHDGAFGPGETKPGEGVVVAVIDTGVDPIHPDIAYNRWTNPGEIPENGLDDDDNGFVDDWLGWNFATGSNVTIDEGGHGTHVAGTIAASLGGGRGVVGVAPFAHIMPVGGLRSDGRGTSAGLAQAVIYAVENGADIVSNSWGGPASGVISDAFAFADSAGVLAVASAGNDNADASSTSPANLPSVIAVAALAPDDTKASFSNFGAVVDIAAPGTGILSLAARGGNNAIGLASPERLVETDYLWLNGTSMSCPHVSGALAVLMSRFPNESADELRGRLRAGARNIDGANPDFVGGLGSGALDLAASLATARVPVFEIAHADPGILPIGGGRLQLVVHLHNDWTSASDVVATLTSSNPNLRIDDGIASFGDIASGETRSNESNPFELRLSRSIPVGSTVDFDLRVESAGYAKTLRLSLKKALFEDATQSSGLPGFEFVSFHALFDDYGGDGLPDLAIVGFLTWRFFKNLGGGRFENAVPETGIAPAGGAPRQALFADFDADGDRDILVGNGAGLGFPSQLFENTGSLPYVDRGVASGIANKPLGPMLTVDYDGDGWLDVLGGVRQLVLLRNNGDGTFSDLTAAANFRVAVGQQNLVHDMLAFDYDDDGDPDVAGVKDAHGIFLLRNQGDGTFVDATSAAGIDNSRRGGWALAAGDYDNDGDLDLFVTGIGPSSDPARNALYRNEGDGRFTNVIAQSGDLALGGPSGWNGTTFFDYDNDADLDLFLDAEGLPNAVDYHVLYRNDGGGRFAIVNEIAYPPGFWPGSGTGAIADFDRDGSLDIFALDGNFGGRGTGGLLRNRVGALHHSLRIDLAGGPPRDPFGARVRVVAGGVAQIREMQTGSVETLPLHFGLGDATRVDRIEIRWPDGKLQRIADVAADQVLHVAERGAFCTGSADVDGDGLLDSCDSCPAVADPGQEDTDADGVGDACNGAADPDGDEWADAFDVCPGVFDPAQADANGDGRGDACPAEVPALPPGAWLALLAGIATAAARKPRAIA